jgi:hypothetical protein
MIRCFYYKAETVNFFPSDAEVKAAVCKWTSSQLEIFCMGGMNKWTERLEKYVALNGDWVEK